MIILALNCGSSSVKYQLYDWEKQSLLKKGSEERIGSGGSPDHTRALEIIIKKLETKIDAVGHRVVHGGENFHQSVLINEEVLNIIRGVSNLAPLHNPPNIAGIEAAQKILPDIPHIAVFDTAFHQTIPLHAYIYAVPYEWYQAYGIRRYGFHGTSHLYVSKRAAVLLNKKPSEVNVITLHIGNGVSITAVKGGISVDTSMGLTPLEGAVMGTRCGDIDPSIVLYMTGKQKVSSKELDGILNRKSGLLGITGKFMDRRDILKAAAEGDTRCQLAIEIECYRLKKYIGSYAAAMGGVDAIVMTAGVGEKSPEIREKVLTGLDFMGAKLDLKKNKCVTHGEKDISTADSKVKIFVIPTNEELVFIEDVVAILENRYDVHTKFNYSFQDPDYKPAAK